MTIFTDEELRRRQRAFAATLARRSLDAAFLRTADSVCYLSGVPLLSEWGRPMWVVVTPNDQLVLIGARIELENMVQESVANDVWSYDDGANVLQAALAMVAKAIQVGGPAKKIRLGIEEQVIPASILRALQSALPGAEFIDVTMDLAELRVIKSDEELSLLKIGGDVAKVGASVFLDALKPGATEMEVASAAVAEMNRTIGELVPAAATSTYSYCHVGDHTLSPHLHPTGRRIERGDLVALNVFPVISGYCIELERTLVLGDPTKEQERAFDAVTEAFNRAKTVLRPSTRMSEIDNLTRTMLAERGYGDFIRHGSGHAHGIMIGAASREELGELRIYNDRRLEAGMINSVEPGVYIPGLGGFRHSDVMIVTDGEPECVTEFPTTLSKVLTD